MRCDLARAVSSALLLLCLCAPHLGSGSGEVQQTAKGVYPPHLLISELYPCAACDDEYIVIANDSGQSVNLRNWTLDDGEGTLLFVVDVVVHPLSEIVISFNGTSYFAAYGRLPDIEVFEDGETGSVAEKGLFRLADSGDGLFIRSPDGSNSDAVFYGQVSAVAEEWNGEAIAAPKKGEVLKRYRDAGWFVDTDCSNDWATFREYRYGYTESDTRVFHIPSGNLTAYLSPDCSLGVVLEAIENARYSIMICSYELSSSPVCSSLTRAAARGVDVDILVDGAPSGGMDPREIACLSFLARAGIDVSVLKGDMDRGIVGHIGPLHAKYMVVDSCISLIQSENFVETGVPSDRIFGNRGWGIKIADASLAGFIQELFEGDSRPERRDVLAWILDPRFNGTANLPDAPVSWHPDGLFEPYVSPEPSRITLYTSPDSSILVPFLSELIGASRSIWAEQFQLDLSWKYPNTEAKAISPIIRTLVSRMENGTSVRMLCDSTWFNLERNSEVAAYLSEAAARSGLQGEFRLLDNSSPITVLHNKGLIVNGDTTVVSSNNWVYSSFARNRELAASVLCPAVAAYFAEAFLTDWIPDVTPPVPDPGEDVCVSSGTSLTISANRSFDERGIASYRWDIYSDGSTDSWDSWISFRSSVPGTYRITLTVEDSWGNEASDDICVKVLAEGEGRQLSQPAVVRWLWLFPILLGALVVLAKAWLRARAS